MSSSVTIDGNERGPIDAWIDGGSSDPEATIVVQDGENMTYALTVRADGYGFIAVEFGPRQARAIIAALVERLPEEQID